MSRWQQIRVRIEAHWDKGGFSRRFPRLAQWLAGLNPPPPEPTPPLYELVPYLVHLSQLPEREPALTRALDHHGPRIIELHRQIGEAISGWRLGRAETLLNDLEDAFLDLEQELPQP
jgi:hypothetical protein